MRESNDSGFGYLRMRHQCRLHLGRPEAMAADVDDVVHPAGDPPIAVRVPPGAVAGEVFAGEGAEVSLHEPLVVAVERARHAGPGVGDAEIALRHAVQQLALAIHQHRLHAGQRQGGGAGLQGRGAGQGG